MHWRPCSSVTPAPTLIYPSFGHLISSGLFFASRTLAGRFYQVNASDPWNRPVTVRSVNHRSAFVLDDTPGLHHDTQIFARYTEP
jgi:hypothetical protein